MRPAARLEIVGPLLNSRNRNPSPAANDRTGLGQSGQARTHVYTRRRRAPRVDATSMSPENNEGAGNAGCALHPRSRVQNCAKKRTRAYRFSGGNPTFPAQWFYGLRRALPGDRAFLPPSPARYFSRTWRQRRGVRTTRLCRPRRLAFVSRNPSRPLHPTARS